MKNDLETISLAFTNACIRVLKDQLLGIYFYGSSVCGDFTATSDYDFVVIIRKISKLTLLLVEEVLSEIRNVPGNDKLEGGFHTVSFENPWENTMGIWVDKGSSPAECEMYVEPDSIFAIVTKGKRCYGPEASTLLPIVTDEALTEFEKQYILSFCSNISRRSTTAQRLYGAFLNACRSACFLVDHAYMTKTQAATRIVSLVPELRYATERALQLRLSAIVEGVTEDDITDCKNSILILINLIREKGIIL